MMYEYLIEGKVKYKTEWIKDVEKTVQAETDEEALDIFNNEIEVDIGEEIQTFDRAASHDSAYDLNGRLTEPGKIIEKYELKDINIVLQEISEVLEQADGDFIEEIANQVLSHPVEYIEDDNFRQRQKD